MKQLKLTVLLTALVLTTSFVVAQNTADSISIPAKTISKVPISEPWVSISSALEEKVTKETLLNNPFVIAKDPKGEIEWEILSYRVVFVANGKEEAPITVTGGKFSEQVISRIQSAASGTMIEFSEIKLQSVVGGTRVIGRPLVVRIP